MSLRNNLYTLTAENTVRFNPAHPIFAGHFPGHPVVPGACLVQIAQELLSDTLQQPVFFTEIRNLKFRQTVTPDLEVRFDIHDNKCEITNSNRTEIYAQFAATYMCADTDL